MMKINNAFTIGERVYVVSDNEQRERQVIGIHVTPLGLTYEVSFDGETSEFYEIELSTEKGVI